MATVQYYVKKMIVNFLKSGEKKEKFVAKILPGPMLSTEDICR